jgi:anti-sigma factor RsiW
MREHEHIEKQLADYAVGGLSDRRRARIERHVRECAECRRELAALEQTGALLGSVPLEDAPGGTWEAVRRDIVARGLPGARARLRWAYRAAVGAVAMAMILLAVFLLWPGDLAEQQMLSAEIAEQELQATVEGHLAAAWAAPLADEAAMGLRFVQWEDNG